MFDVLFAGLIHGSAYALVAVGMSLIFGVTNVANFAQGSIVAVGMMIAWWLGSSWGWGIVPTFVAVLVVTALLGLIMNVAIIAPLEGRKPIAALLATIGVGQVLDNGLQIVFGPQTRPFPKLLQTYNLQVAGVRFGTSDIVMVTLAVLSMLGLWAFLKFGKAGQAIRATSQDPEAAMQMGIPVKAIRNLSFVIGAVLAGVSGIFVGLFNGNINPMNGGTIGMTAFVAATIGGLGSIPGAVVGGLVLGVVEAFGISLFGDGAHDLITFGALIIILIVKPQGLLGPKTDVKSEPLTGTFLGGGRAVALPWWGNLIGAVALVSTPFFFNDYLSGVGTPGRHLCHSRRGTDVDFRLRRPNDSGHGRTVRRGCLCLRDSGHAGALALPGGVARRRCDRGACRLGAHLPRMEVFRPLCRHRHHRRRCGDGGDHSPRRAVDQGVSWHSGHSVPEGVRRHAVHAADDVSA